MEKEEDNNSGTWWLIILLVVGGWFLYRHFSKEIWTGHYTKIGESRVYSSQEFATADACASWLTQQKTQEKFAPTGRENFECGLNCKFSTEWGMYVCKKTFDN
jgi:hypothetical protein